METKKIAGIFAALMLALGIAGFAYAHWSDYVRIYGEVETGELCLEWSFNATEIEPEKPWVANVTWDFVDTTGDGCNDTLYVTFANVYPSYMVNGTLDIHNCGTIPATLVLWDYYFDDYPEGWTCEGIDILKCEFTGDCSQIDPCESLVLDFSIHFNEDTPKNAWADFGLMLWFVNWNAVD